jgi:hypothetical protein
MWVRSIEVMYPPGKTCLSSNVNDKLYKRLCDSKVTYGLWGKEKSAVDFKVDNGWLECGQRDQYRAVVFWEQTSI